MPPSLPPSSGCSSPPQLPMQPGFIISKMLNSLRFTALNPHFLWGYVVLMTPGCGVEEGREEPRVVAVEGRCEAGVGSLSVSVEPYLGAIGPLGNALAAGGGAIWIVESGSNTVSRYEPERGMTTGFVDVGNDRNPYGLFVDEDRGEAFVVNYLANSMSVARMDTGAVMAEISSESLRSPSAVAANATHVFVANVNYLSLAEGFGPGSISVFERPSLRHVGDIETAFKNPQFIEVLQTDEAQWLVISAAGELRFGQTGVEVGSEGGLELWRLSEDPLTSVRDAYGLGQEDTPRVGGPGRPVVTADGRFIYLTSAIAPALFKFDRLERVWIHDAARPFPLYETRRDATHSAVLDDQGLLYVTAFNDDALYIVDTACDAVLAGPIDLGRRPELIEGPQSLVAVPAEGGTDLYFIMSIANGLGRVKIRP
jgi:hypothetical protein